MRIKYKLLFQLLVLAGITAIQAQQIRVACVGNSITAGAWLEIPAEDSYPGVLGNLLGPDYDVKNFGYSGSTLLKNTNSPYWGKPSYQYALGFFPDIVIIMLGSNDSKPENWIYSEEFEDDYISLIESFLIKNSDAQFILCFPPPILENTSRNETLRREIIPKILSVADQTESNLINLFDSFKNRDDLYRDQIHPNEEGYQIIASMVFKKIKMVEDTETPDIPINFSATGTDRSVILSWSQNSETDLGSYVIFRANSIDEELKYYNNVIWPNNSFIDQNVVNGDSIYYKIAAMDLSGNIGGSSPVIMAVPRDATIPFTPSIVDLHVELGKIVLRWAQNLESDLKHYNIYRNSDFSTPLPSGYKIGSVQKPDSVFYDTLLAGHTEYYYSISAVDSSGNESDRSEIVTAFTLNITEVESIKPTITLNPNPFNSKIRFRYNLGVQALVKISIYDLSGRNIYSLVNEIQTAGMHNEIWDGKTSNGIPVSAGLYLYHFEYDQNHFSGKLIYLK